LTSEYYSERLGQCPVWRPRGMSSGTNSSHNPLHVDLRPARLSASSTQAGILPQFGGRTALAPGRHSRWSQPLLRGGAPCALWELRRCPNLRRATVRERTCRT
jgi:hypothetical protein